MRFLDPFPGKRFGVILSGSLFTENLSMPNSSASSARPTGVAVLGCGIIGSAVADALLNETALFRQRAGVSVQLRHVVEKDTERAKKAGIPAKLITDNFDTALKDRDTHVVVELIGGLEPART